MSKKPIIIPGMIPLETHQRAIQQAIKDAYDSNIRVDKFLNSTLLAIINLCCYIDGLAFGLGNVGTEHIAGQLEKKSIELGNVANVWKLKAPRYGVYPQHVAAVFDYADQHVSAIDQLLNHGDEELLFDAIDALDNL